MTITKYNPGFPVRNSLSALVDDFFNKNLGEFVGTDFALSRPSVNIKEGEQEYSIEVAAPGLEKEDFNIQIENDQLKISAQKSAKQEEKTEKYTRREFNFSSFTRTFALPENINQEQIKASYDKGVLTLQLPKTVKVDHPHIKQIEIA
jgi:HSP20 family protein